MNKYEIMFIVKPDLEESNIKSVVNSMKEIVETKGAKVLEEKENLSLVKINLETGRHHQIRVQFANINHSLYGDQKYGKGPQNAQIALWAYKLEFKHPTKDEVMSFECKPKKIGIWGKFEI